MNIRELKRKYPQIPEEELEEAFAELEATINQLIRKYKGR